VTDPQFISVPEFIARTNGGISKSLVYDLLNRGELEGVRLSARKWLIRADALEVLRARQQGG
jgi:predicted DNA-binding transcriptional regulator AlpA